MQNRLNNLQSWVQVQLGAGGLRFDALPGDASLRRYYRVLRKGESWMAMDVPPDTENSDVFVRAAQVLAAAGVQVPDVIAQDTADGFILISDFGDNILLNILDENNAEHYYPKALATLVTLQCFTPDGDDFTIFDERAIRTELQRFEDWFVEKLLGLPVDAAMHRVLEPVYAQLVACVTTQPQVILHRDYHAGNLMVLADDSLGVIDFQDALWGPIAYDVVSLLRDSRIAWPAALVEAWLASYQQLALEKGLLSDDQLRDYQKWFDWTGLQLHIKILGIFARLAKRDNNTTYLQHIPRLIAYIEDVVTRHDEFSEFNTLLNECFVPRMKECQLL